MRSFFWGKNFGISNSAIPPINALPSFIGVREWVGSLLTSGLTFNFTQVKVKGRHAS